MDTDCEAILAVTLPTKSPFESCRSVCLFRVSDCTSDSGGVHARIRCIRSRPSFRAMMNSRRLFLYGTPLAGLAAGAYYYQSRSASIVTARTDSDAKACFKSSKPLHSNRLVFIGDLHSDFAQSIKALQLASLVSKDSNASWTGGVRPLAPCLACVE